MFKWVSTLISNLKKGKNGQPVFYAYRSGWDLESRENNVFRDLTVGGVQYATVSSTDSPVGEAAAKKMDNRIAKKPLEVYKEIIAETPKMDTSNIDAQIKLVTRRLKMFQELGVNQNDEEQALMFLKARKKGLKVKTQFHWASTNLELISALCKKYKVLMVDFSGYSKTIPMEAIDELEAYLKEYARVADEKPVLKLIIDDVPESKERKKDPILLASSPFGRYYYILGAWDKEVAIVDDLVYHGK